MSKLIFGRNGQVRFMSEEEKTEAFEYLRNSTNVVLVHEDNQEQGAWAPEERIHFKSLVGVPEGLLRNMTAGRGNVEGRINCAELIEAVWGKSRSRTTTKKVPNPMISPSSGMCCQVRVPLGTECFICGQVVR
jgi:hypothetical protein